MKNALLLLSIVTVLLSSCHKKDISAYNGDMTSTFTVEGFLISSYTKVPLANPKIALSEYDFPTDIDIPGMTDSTGYFKISYQPTNHNYGLMLHPWMSSYKCVFSDISILQNIPKGQNYNLGKIYTPIYGPHN